MCFHTVLGNPQILELQEIKLRACEVFDKYLYSRDRWGIYNNSGKQT